MLNCLIVLLDLPPGFGYVPPQHSALGGWRNAPGTDAARLASATTGVEVQQHGVLSEWEVRPDGLLPRPAPRSRLMWPHFWDHMPDTLSIAWPWTTGGAPRADATVISPDFLTLPSNGATALLPGQASPAELGTWLAGLRYRPDQVSAEQLARAGYGDSASVRAALTPVLSADNLTQTLLGRGGYRVVAVSLRFRFPPQDPPRLKLFLDEALDCYTTLTPEHQHYCIARSHPVGSTGSQDTVWGPLHMKNWHDNPAAFGRSLAASLGVPVNSASRPPLPASHWHQVRARYPVPRLLRPDVAPVIQGLADDIALALDRFALLPEGPEGVRQQ